MRTTILSATLLLATLLPAAHAGDPCGEILDGLGHSLAGNFQPVLNGSGCLDGSGDLVLELYGMPVFSQVYLVIGLSNIEAPFKQGVLVPSPDLILPMPTTRARWCPAAWTGRWPAPTARWRSPPTT